MAGVVILEETLVDVRAVGAVLPRALIARDAVAVEASNDVGAACTHVTVVASKRALVNGGRAIGAVAQKALIASEAVAVEAFYGVGVDAAGHFLHTPHTPQLR